MRALRIIWKRTRTVVTIDSTAVHLPGFFPLSIARELPLRLKNDLVELMQHCSLILMASRLLVLLQQLRPYIVTDVTTELCGDRAVWPGGGARVVPRAAAVLANDCCGVRRTAHRTLAESEIPW